MLSSRTTCEVGRTLHLAHAAAVDELLAAYFEAARGAFSHNTERALRADVQIFAAWCRRHFRAAFPASASTVVAFVDDMAAVKTPATVRRYVSSIAALHRTGSVSSPLRVSGRYHTVRGRTPLRPCEPPNRWSPPRMRLSSWC